MKDPNILQIWPVGWFCLCVGLLFSEETWIVLFERVFTYFRSYSVGLEHETSPNISELHELF
jgi:hypothetical protein